MGGGDGDLFIRNLTFDASVGVVKGGGGSWAQTTAYSKFTRFEKIVIFQSFLKPRIRIPTFKCQLKLVIMLCSS